jgi:hypothetical protein
VNIPWPSGGFGDGDYIYAFQKIIMPIAYEFNPDLVISELAASDVRWYNSRQFLLASMPLMATTWAAAMSLRPPMAT